MKNQIDYELGQYSIAGRKYENQDFHGAYLPQAHVLEQKGLACAIADGISSSNVSQIASETAVSSFLSDYFSTPDSWSVKTSAKRVLTAINSWLYAQTQQSQGRFDKDRGYVCTFSALIIKNNTAHIFHVGDTRIYRLQNGVYEQLTTDHRVQVSHDKSYLSRALGIGYKVDVDYHTFTVYPNDIFLMMSDGVYEFLKEKIVKESLNHSQDLNHTAKKMVQLALELGSDDNLTLQILKINSLYQSNIFQSDISDLKFISHLEHGQMFEGYQIQKVLHQNHRSCIYLALDPIRKKNLVIKIPASEIKDDPKLLEQFFLEEWVAKRIKNQYVLSWFPHAAKKNYVFQSYEYVQGQSLAEWFRRKGNIPLDQVIHIIEQVSKALNAFHRLEMLHQDIRPENVMIDDQNKIKLIDFGATAVRGLAEINPQHADVPLGTLAFMAPEYFIAKTVSQSSDQFSLAVLAYYLLSRQLPYGTDIARCQNVKQLKSVQYHSILSYRKDISPEIDAALHKGLSLDANQRYQALSEFIYDLKHPNRQLSKKLKKPLKEKNPLCFWQILSGILFLSLLLLMAFKF